MSLIVKIQGKTSIEKNPFVEKLVSKRLMKWKMLPTMPFTREKHTEVDDRNDRGTITTEYMLK